MTNACRSNNNDLVRFLFEIMPSNLDISLQVFSSNSYAIRLAIAYGFRKHINSALHKMVLKNDVETSRLLINNGAKMTKTCIRIARMDENENMIKLIHQN